MAFARDIYQFVCRTYILLYLGICLITNPGNKRHANTKEWHSKWTYYVCYTENKLSKNSIGLYIAVIV